MVAAWPIGVPTVPDDDGWEVVEHARAPRETEMEGGNIRARKGASYAIGILAYQITMTRAEYATFKAWLASIGDGTAEFTMNVFDGLGCPTRTCRIRGGSNQVRTKGHGPKVKVSFQLDVRGL